MIMRWLTTILCLTLVSPCVIDDTQAQETSSDNRPNIIFIVTDDQAPWTLSLYDNPNAHTPELDELAREGALLHNAFATSAVCSPARASLITSRYPSETGILNYIPGSKVGMDTSLTTWPEVLQGSGYTTALVGKWHLGEKEQYLPTNRGYDYFTGFTHGAMRSKSPHVYEGGHQTLYEGRYTPDLLTDKAIDFIDKFRGSESEGRPFAISLHYWAPHANTDFPNGFSPDHDDRSWLPLKEVDLRRWKNRDVELPNPDFPSLNKERAKRMTREYHASVHSVDRNIGRLTDYLDKTGVADNTIIVFTSDHGYMLGHHGLWHKGNGRWLTHDKKDPNGRYKNGRPNMYDHSLKVPGIVRWPGVIEPGTEVSEVIAFIDWFPTLLSMSDIEAPDDVHLRGDNALPLLRGEATEWNNDLFAQYKALRTYRTEDWKIVWNFESSGFDEFYDLTVRPLEKRNLIDTDSIHVQQSSIERSLIKMMLKIDDPIYVEQIK